MKKSTITGLVVFIVVFIVVIFGYTIYDNLSKNKYSCIDPNTNTYYSFSTEEEMHEVCDFFSPDIDISKTKYKDIYNDLMNTNDVSYTFYPYINSDNKMSIIVAAIDCSNKSAIKNKVKTWFNNHGYKMEEYEIEYEFSCE